MSNKYLALSSGILLLLLLGLTLLGFPEGRFRSAMAASEYSAHRPGEEFVEHGSYTQQIPEHQTHEQDEKHGSSDHHAPEAKLLSPEVSWQGWLPVILVFFPLATAILIPLFHSSQRIRSFISVGTAVSSFGIILLMFVPIVKGINIAGQIYKGIFCSLHFFLGFDATFKVDPAALLVAGVTVFLWILSTIHWLSYKEIEKKHTRYETLILASLSMNLGVLMAGDFLTLFLFFEGMVIFPYSLIAHKEDKGALRGANMYLYLGVATSLCLFFGIMLLYHFTGDISIRAMGPEINANVPGAVKYILAALMIIGFGGKAGVFFEHIWLPEAHPVAPTPASCLLSGAMIKAGAYGIFRVANMIFIPPDWGATLEWVTVRHVGYAVIWLGIITMFLGVLNALISANSKRMLAYHSVSQMGYIVMGIGCAAYLGADGAMGLAGALYHIVNHALFKASLFLTVGTVYFRTHELDMYKMGGLWRNMPFTCVAMFIAVCGISGIPGFNGFASKTILHHSIIEAYEHSAHYAANGLPDFKLRIAEIIFMITAGGTFASNMKLWVLDFLGKCPKKYEKIQPAPTPMKVALGLVSVVILFIGFFPNWLLETIIGPALAYFHFNPSSHPYHILYNTHIVEGVHSTIPILYDLKNFTFFSSSEVIHNLLGCGDAIIFGGTIFILGMRMGWFHTVVPAYLTVEYYYQAIFQGFKRSCYAVFAKLDVMYDHFWELLIFGRSIAPELVKIVGIQELWDICSRLEDRLGQAIDKVIYSQSMQAVVKEAGKRKEKGTWQRFKKWNTCYDEMVDKLIFSDGVKSILKKEDDLSTEEKLILKKKGTWQRFKKLDRYYDETVDKLIFSDRVKSILKKEDDLSTEEKLVLKELSSLDEKYDNAVEKAILGQRIEAHIDGGEGEEKIWQDLRQLKKEYGEVFDKMILNKSIQVLIKQREKKAPAFINSTWWERFSEFDTLSYDTSLDKILFGNTDPSAKPQENWFKKFCRHLSSIHSGDIGRYISWIIIIMAIMIAVLIGKLYITSFLGLLLMITLIIFLVITAIFLS